MPAPSRPAAFRRGTHTEAGLHARAATKSRRGPSPVKRRKILSAARRVFAQSGFDRASMESIAAEANVSNKTIYNHFGDKARLFQVVIEDSSTALANAQIDIVRRHFTPPPSDPGDLEAALVAFALDWLTPMPEYGEHRALVEQIRAEVGRVPDTVIDIWQQAGPARVRTALARAFTTLSDAGLLHATDGDLTALHFSRLVAIEDPLRPGARPTRKQLRVMTVHAVHAFLHGYRSNPGPTTPKPRTRGTL